MVVHTLISGLKDRGRWIDLIALFELEVHQCWLANRTLESCRSPSFSSGVTTSFCVSPGIELRSADQMLFI